METDGAFVVVVADWDTVVDADGVLVVVGATVVAATVFIFVEEVVTGTPLDVGHCDDEP